ncbi:MAG: GxxExxY protein [Verrucomicrobiales bacterium]|nr:GxxExxY protein [Verrucomicrobiales bacterium]
MNINDVSGMIVDRSVRIHKALGPGLLESVYQRVLSYELRKSGLAVETEVPIPIEWDGHVISESFRADMIVGGVILIELKSVGKILPVHKKQTFTYLKLADIRLGLLLNFGESLLKDGIYRIANGVKD